MSDVELEHGKTFFPDGTVEWEGHLRNGEGEGRQIAYYPNGQKAHAWFLANGKVHGEVKWWDTEGKLLDFYAVEHGTGPHRMWYGNGRKKAEGQTKNGLWVGKVVLWDEDGKKLCTTYHIKGGEVKKQRYLSAMAKDPTLPPID
jgi:antitoxin component YwqK of YwqJK toxin-antitoxin module